MRKVPWFHFLNTERHIISVHIMINVGRQRFQPQVEPSPLSLSGIWHSWWVLWVNHAPCITHAACLRYVIISHCLNSSPAVYLCDCETLSFCKCICPYCDHTLNPLLLAKNKLILANFLPFSFVFNLYISAIAIDHDSSFEKDQDILVLPLDSVKFDTVHEQLTQDVLKHFGKVQFLLLDYYKVRGWTYQKLQFYCFNLQMKTLSTCCYMDVLEGV